MVLEVGRPIHQLALSEDGSRLAVATDSLRVSIWNLQTGEQIGGFEPGFRPSVQEMSFSPDGRSLALLGNHFCLVVWDVHSNREIFREDSTYPYIGSPKFSRRSDLVALVADGGWVIVHEVESGKRLANFQPNGGRTNEITFDRAADRVISIGGYGTVCVSCPRTGKRFHRFRTNSTGLCLASDRRDSRVALASWDRVDLWDVERNFFLGSIGPINEGLRFLDFNPSHSYLLTMGGPHVIRWWSLASFTCTEELAIRARVRLPEDYWIFNGFELVTGEGHDTVEVTNIIEECVQQMTNLPEEWKSVSDRVGGLVLADWLEENRRPDEARRLRCFAGES
jgi:WD40 repeat protein